MSLLNRLISVVRSWRGSRVGHKPARRAHVAMEQLDHRQLLSVNFTGNVATDFPATKQPGVVILPDNANVQHPNLSPALKPIIKVSGFDINEIRVSYDPTDDTLNIGLGQPLNQKPGLDGIPGQYPVIAGDADNNGNAGTVSPATLAVAPGFAEFPDLQGPQGMGAFLDLKGTGYADVVAGFSPTGGLSNGAKPYQVADAIVNTGIPPSNPVLFGTPLPNNTGNVYLQNSPLHPNLEFNITHFSQLYQSITGHALTSASNVNVGAFGVASNNIGVSDAFFPEQQVNIGQATLPPVCPPVPPVSPPVLINPHSNRHINTAHNTNVRVTVLSSSGFDATQINGSTVRLGGATPFTEFPRHILHNGLTDETFVFKGLDVNLPAGLTQANLTGQTFSGQSFSTSELVFNRNDTFYTSGQIAARDQRTGRTSATEAGGGATAASLNSGINSLASEIAGLGGTTAGALTPAATQTVAAAQAAIQQQTSNPVGVAAAQNAAGAPVTVAIPRRAAATATHHAGARKATVPNMASASSFRGLGHLQTKVPAQTMTAQSLNAQDAALAALASTNNTNQPQSAA